MYCKNCGATINEADAFCPECGMQVEKNYVKCAVCGCMFPSNSASCPVCHTPVGGVKKNNNNLPVILIAVASIVVIIAIIVVILAFLPKDGGISVDNNMIVSTEAEEMDYNDNSVESQDGYIFPDSDSEYMSKADFAGKSMEEVALIRNEIYARRGYVFTTSPYKEYFGEKDWYSPDPTFNESQFNRYERANVDLILEYEKEKGWRSDSGSTDEDKSDTYVFPYSNSMYMTRSDLVGRSMAEIALIRNEIYARRGYIFTKSPYKEYFNAKSWYKPNKSFSESMFNKYEKANIDLIRSYEKTNGGSSSASTSTSGNKNSGYIFPASNSRYMTRSDLAGRSKSEVALIRNEIYARRGYVFTKSPYKEYFNAKDWYVPNKYFSESSFNKYEKANKDLIISYEQEKGWR